MAFGKNLQTILKARGQTQAWLARRLGANRGKISDWCLGRGNPKIEEVAEVARILGVSMENLTQEELSISSIPILGRSTAGLAGAIEREVAAAGAKVFRLDTAPGRITIVVEPVERGAEHGNANGEAEAGPV